MKGKKKWPMLVVLLLGLGLTGLEQSGVIPPKLSGALQGLVAASAPLLGVEDKSSGS